MTIHCVQIHFFCFFHCRSSFAGGGFPRFTQVMSLGFCISIFFTLLCKSWFSVSFDSSTPLRNGCSIFLPSPAAKEIGVRIPANHLRAFVLHFETCFVFPKYLLHASVSSKLLESVALFVPQSACGLLSDKKNGAMDKGSSSHRGGTWFATCLECTYQSVTMCLSANRLRYHVW